MNHNIFELYQEHNFDLMCYPSVLRRALQFLSFPENYAIENEIDTLLHCLEDGTEKKNNFFFVLL